MDVDSDDGSRGPMKIRVQVGYSAYQLSAPSFLVTQLSEHRSTAMEEGAMRVLRRWDIIDGN